MDRLRTGFGTAMIFFSVQAVLVLAPHQPSEAGGEDTGGRIVDLAAGLARAVLNAIAGPFVASFDQSAALGAAVSDQDLARLQQNDWML